MNLTPREKDKLLVSLAAMVARNRLARGVKLNHPEAVALITDFVVEGARDGRSVADLMQAGAHVIRAKSGKHADAPRHTHALSFQFVYVLKGWAIFEYEGHGEHKLVAGSTVYQPPGIKHKEIAHSDDFEVLEITMPADFETTVVD